MKKLLLSLALTLIFISCNEKSTVEPIVNVEKDVSLKTNYDLPEVTITGYRDYTSTNAFEAIYTLYVGADYHVSSNPYRSFTEEYAGENVDNIPGLKAKIIAFLNKELGKLGFPEFTQDEMVFLNTLKVRQIFSVYHVMVQTWGLGFLATRTTFNGEGIDDGYSNAFMHVYMSNRLVQALGMDLAGEFLTIHEANQSGLSTQMDSKNNQIGINLGITNNMVVYSTLYSMAVDGQLWTIDKSSNILGKYKFVPKSKLPTYQN